MDSLDRYVDLMITAQNRERPEGYCERHHIWPTAFVKKDKLWTKRNNKFVVELTGAEHFLAHQLLAEIFPDSADHMTTAFRLLKGQASADGGEPTGENYSIMKEKRAKRASASMKGRPPEEHHLYDDTMYILTEIMSTGVSKIYVGTQYNLRNELGLCQSHLSRHIKYVIKGIRENGGTGRMSVAGYKVIGTYDNTDNVINKHLLKVV